MARRLSHLGAHLCPELQQPVSATAETETIRVAAVQTKHRKVDWRLTDATKVMAAVEGTLGALEQIVHSAAERGCELLVFPEDTLGLLNWEGVADPGLRAAVLDRAVTRMIEWLGAAAASHSMYLVVCSDFVEPADGGMCNTAFFLGKDGMEIGRYHKVCPTWGESGERHRGDAFPVFQTPDLGAVGMLICYDLVVPETARCLALGGADIILFPTMGGAAVGDDDIGLQALRVRAAENHVYLVVAFSGGGSMIISPRGKILATADGPDGLAVADIQVTGGREGGDAMNAQRDMRARLFRERNPRAFQLLTHPEPPVLEKVPIDMSARAAGQIMARVLTSGEDEFALAEAIGRAVNRRNEAIERFETLAQTYRGSWIERASRDRLSKLRAN